MLFNSYEFLLLFLPIVVGGFVYVARFGHQYALTWLVAGSLFFYGWWNPYYLTLLIASIFFNYIIGQSLQPVSDSKKFQRKLLLCIGVGVNLGILGYYKYFNFIQDTANFLFASEFNIESIILPIGISFFTFQQIAYLVDTYQNKAEEHKFLHYCLFVSFFPQLIAGPIVHHKEILPQFLRAETFKLNFDNIVIGLSIFSIGLFKKVCIADNLALIATPVFTAAETGENLHFFLAWRGAIAFTLQLYFDFSAYSDMAIGIARMFGIKLPLNFHSPYKAASIIDFWRRWHMTLSRFLRDYVYIPLGGSRKGKLRRYINLLITMLLGGLWHGAGWTFVFWGGLHGIYLIINHAWRRIRSEPTKNWLATWAARTVTFFAVALAWVFFRTESFDGALNMLTGMMSLPQNLVQMLGPVALGLEWLGFNFEGPNANRSNIYDLCYLFFWLMFMWYVPNTQQWFARQTPALDYYADTSVTQLNHLQWGKNLVWALIIGAILVMGLLNLTQVSEFLYFQF